ncbi:MAG TPA: DUF3467 domain-containing protein [Candidatus Methanoperedens sp.]|nr:DUF3467 domain-containing protein [Candidatus Methanoperedens sp.]HLB72360.1 DUF3467 domain-containing protein [Candidatus Methanoperedens sp.]
MKKKEKKEITPDEVKHRVINSFYSNGMGSGFSQNDFYIDFIQLPFEEGENWANTTRIFLAPTTFKDTVKFLKERLDDYEKEYGEIKSIEEKSE